MPFLIECDGIRDQKKLKACMNFYSKLYERNLPAVRACVKGEPATRHMECVRLYSTLCKGEPRPSNVPPPRSDIPADLITKYVVRCRMAINSLGSWNFLKWFA